MAPPWSPPPNTFRPIQDGCPRTQPSILHTAYPDVYDGDASLPAADPDLLQAGCSGIICDPQLLCSPGQPIILSPVQSLQGSSKLGQGRCAPHAWRQGSENWSSTGSRQSSRPGSAVQNSSSRPPSSSLLYCKSNNSSTSEVNFHQLSVGTRRAAFRSQKWSHSLEGQPLVCQPVVTAVTSPPGPSGVRRRQGSIHQQQNKSLDLDSGYLGSPAAGAGSSWQSQEANQSASFSVTSPVSCYDPCSSGAGVTSPQQLPKIEGARRELEGLIKDQQEATRQDFPRCFSLPSFQESFQTSSVAEHMRDHMVLKQEEEELHPEPQTTLEELDALDEEIKQIVSGQSQLSPQTCRGEFQTVSGTDFSNEPYIQSPFFISLKKPQPIRSSTIIFSPTGDDSSVQETHTMVTQSGGEVILVQSGNNNEASNNPSEPMLLGNQDSCLLNNQPEVQQTIEDQLDFGEEGQIMLAVVRTVTQTYENPIHHNIIEGKVNILRGPAIDGYPGLVQSEVRKQQNSSEQPPVILIPTFRPSNSLSRLPSVFSQSSVTDKNILSESEGRTSTTVTPSVSYVIPCLSVTRSSSSILDSSPSQQQPVGFKKTSEFTGKVVDLPRPKPFRANHCSQSLSQTDIANPSTSSVDQSQNLSAATSSKMLLDSCFASHIGHSTDNFYSDAALSSPSSPHQTLSLHSPCSSTGNFFQFPSGSYSDCSTAIKEEPSQWTVPSLDLPPASDHPLDPLYQPHTSTAPSSPMLLSPAMSNLNTPRVSLSSVRSHGACSDLSARIRSSHSSLHSLHSTNASPLNFPHSSQSGDMMTIGSAFGHSVTAYHDYSQNYGMMEVSPPQMGYVTPPRSGYSSPSTLPSHENSNHHHYPSTSNTAPPSYEQSVVQQNYRIEPTSPYLVHHHDPSLPPPYPFNQLKSDPSLYPSTPLQPPTVDTPDPDSLLSDCGPDTPDSSVKEEPSEEGLEAGGVLTCRWRMCGKEFGEKKHLVDHVNTNHIEHKKGCEDFPCFWESCPRRLKPFNAKYKLLTHMRVHTGEKPYSCKQEGCVRSFARLENLKIHNRSHTGEKPFLCKFQCSKAFSNSSDRAKHEQTHKDPKPYRCEVMGCLKRYTDPSSLRKHVKNHTKEEQEQIRVERMTTVGSCQRIPTDTGPALGEAWQEAGHSDPNGLNPNLTLMSSGGGLVRSGHEVGGYSGYPGGVSPYHTPPQYRRQYLGVEGGPQHFHRRGEMTHQPNSLDSVEGEVALPFDSVPIRFESSGQFGTLDLLSSEQNDISLNQGYQ